MQLVNPSGGAVYARSGTMYRPDASGVVTAGGQDVQDLLSAGYIPVDYANALDLIGGLAYGGSLATIKTEGNIYRNNALNIAGCGADTTDDILLGIALDAGAFDAVGRGLVLSTNGNTAANGNNKRIKLWVNPTMAGQTVTPIGAGPANTGVITGGTVSGVGSGILLFDSGVITSNNLGWEVLLSFYKQLAANSQVYNVQNIIGTVHGGTSKMLSSTMAENAIMNFVLTGASPTTGAANDVVLDMVSANWLN